MKLDLTIEEKIRKEIKKLAERGRRNWDYPHTLTAVKWGRILIEKLGGDEKTIIPALYFHDSGYPDLGEKYVHKDVMASKKGHAEIGSENAKSFLPKLGYFSKEEIEKIAYLVANHDKHDNIDEHDRQIVFEADGLAQIDPEHCTPSYDKASYIEFLDTYFEKRKKYIKSDYVKNLTKEMLKNAREYSKKM